MHLLSKMALFFLNFSAHCSSKECRNPPNDDGCYKPGKCTNGHCIYEKKDAGADCKNGGKCNNIGQCLGSKTIFLRLPHRSILSWNMLRISKNEKKSCESKAPHTPQKKNNVIFCLEMTVVGVNHKIILIQIIFAKKRKFFSTSKTYILCPQI